MSDQQRVVVVGAGNAALVAALAAHEAGAEVRVLEAATREERGGNSRFSGGIFRTVHDGLASLQPLLHPTNARWLDRVDVASYPRDRFLGDWMATSAGQPDPALVEMVVDRSLETVRWMHARGVQWELAANKLVDPDKLEPGTVYNMAPGGALRALGEGIGLMKCLFAAVEAAGIEVSYDAPAAGLLTSGSTVEGVRMRRADHVEEVRGTVVLASGGFESNPEMRLRYLGHGWDLVKVRGSRFNMGVMLTQALLSGAQPAGHWGGAHASPLDAAAPAVGDLRLTDKMSRYSYPYALLVNTAGDRFVDEGEDEVWLTYAKTGWAVRAQDRALAYQVFDQKTVHLLEPRYRTGTPVEAETIEGLAELLGVPVPRLAATVEDFNAAVAADAGERFVPFAADGLSAEPAGQLPKSNWAQRLDAPPFVAYPVTCGITFTYGGLKVDDQARVLDTEGVPMPGLYAAGEITGNFFFHNYAAGSGLMRGAVFGRLAGEGAAAFDCGGRAGSR
ncbi:MAG: FAD-dependent oxidoreductase [Acidimicrobiia bacterium]|nr:FAD-dependent oxidoreductase [Acidimicrobiia bacterium]